MTTTAQREPELKRQIGLGTATAIVISEVIGVGIFLTPAGMAKALGSPLWLFLVWLLMGVMALCGALCYGQLLRAFPAAGGSYVYLRELYGRRTAFLYGWTSFLLGDPGITAALAVGLSSHVGYLTTLSPVATKAIAIGAIAAVATINVLGVHIGVRVAQVLTVLKLGALASIVLCAVAFRLGSVANFLPLVAQREGSQPLGRALSMALVAAFFSFGGWWDLSKLAGEARDPGRTLPRAMALGILVVTLVYLSTSAVFLYLVPLERVASGQIFAAQASEAVFGRLGGQLFSLIVSVAVFGSLMMLMMTAPRVYYAMAQDGLFFRKAAALHPRLGTPVRATVLQAGLASLMVVLGAFEQIVAYSVLVLVSFIALTVAGVLIPERATKLAAYRIPAHPLPALVFLILVLLLMVMLGSANPKQALLGVAVIVLGLPAYRRLERNAG